MWSLFWAVPAPDESYILELNELLQQYRAEGEDALPLYLAAFERHKEIVTTLGFAGYRDGHVSSYLNFGMEGLAFVNAANWNEPRLARSVQVVEALRPSIDLMIEAAHMPALVVPFDREFIEGAGFQADPQLLHPLRSVPRFRWTSLMRGHAMSTAIIAAANAGDWDRSLQLTEAMLLKARQHTQSPLPNDWTLGTSEIDALVFDWAGVLHTFDVPPEVCLRLELLLDQYPFPNAPYARWIEGMRVQHVALTQWHYSSDGVPVIWAEDRGVMNRSGLSISWNPSTLDRLRNVFIGFDIAHQEEAIRRVNEFFDHFTKFAALSSEDRRQFDRSVFPEFSVHLIRAAQGEDRDDSTGMRYQETTLDYLLDHTFRTDEALDLLRIMIALELHHAKTGSWPVSLDELELAPGLLINERDNSTYIYKRTDLSDLDFPGAYDDVFAEMKLEMPFFLNTPDDQMPGPYGWPWGLLPYETHYIDQQLDPAQWIKWSDSTHPALTKLSP